MISFPAPALCQGADEELMLEMGAVVFPGRIKRWPGENGLRIWVEGDHRDPETRSDALAVFQIVLGILRAWRPAAGERRDETRGGLGEGSIRDEQGNQYALVGTALTHVTTGGEVTDFATRAARGVQASQHCRTALWLNGRSNRMAADYYMIYECAEKEFNRPKGIQEALGLSGKSLSRLTMSINHLSPLAGGRHTGGNDQLVVMSLNEQSEYVARLLRLWIGTY